MKKLIIYGPNKAKKMSFEDVYTMYQKLVYKRAHKWTNWYEFDDLVQIGYITLWQAYENYVVEKGVGFSYYADTAIRHNFVRYHERNKGRYARETSKIKKISSLDAPVKGAENITLNDVMFDEIDFTEIISDDDIASKAIKKIQNLKEKNKKAIILKLQGYTLDEIGKRLGTSRQGVHYTIKVKFEKIIREMKELCVI